MSRWRCKVEHKPGDKIFLTPSTAPPISSSTPQHEQPRRQQSYRTSTYRRENQKHPIFFCFGLASSDPSRLHIRDFLITFLLGENFLGGRHGEFGCQKRLHARDSNVRFLLVGSRILCVFALLSCLIATFYISNEIHLAIKIHQSVAISIVIFFSLYSVFQHSVTRLLYLRVKKLLGN